MGRGDHYFVHASTCIQVTSRLLRLANRVCYIEKCGLSVFMQDPFLDYLEDVTAVIVSCRLEALTFSYAGPSVILSSRR